MDAIFIFLIFNLESLIYLVLLLLLPEIWMILHNEGTECHFVRVPGSILSGLYVAD